MVDRIVICFDGTWDRADPNTGVAKRLPAGLGYAPKNAELRY
jgi:uncharacterized protein (DUF2235 family)